MLNISFRRKLRIPLFIIGCFIILFLILCFKHVKHVHQKREMLSRFLAYERFLHNVKNNVDDLNRKMLKSENSIREISKLLSSLPRSEHGQSKIT